MHWNFQKWLKGDEGITSTICLPSSNAFRRLRIDAFSKLRLCLYGFSYSGTLVAYLILRSVVWEGWCTAFCYLFSSASGTLHLSKKDNLRKVKVQKDCMPIGNKPSPSLCNTPQLGQFYGRRETDHCWLAGWPRLGLHIYLSPFPAVFPLWVICFRGYSNRSGMCPCWTQVPLQTEFKAPLALQWIRRHFLLNYLSAGPELARVRGNFHQNWTW